jgi:hypothetical protein
MPVPVRFAGGAIPEFAALVLTRSGGAGEDAAAGVLVGFLEKKLVIARCFCAGLGVFGGGGMAG